MIFRSKEEISYIKQRILDYCTEFKKTGDIARALDIRCADVNNYAYDLWQNGNFLDRMPEKTRTNTRTWAYKTAIPEYKYFSKSPTVNEEAKWNYIHVPLFGYQPIEHDVHGRVIKADLDDNNKSYVEHIKLADVARRKAIKSDRVHVSGSSLSIAV